MASVVSQVPGDPGRTLTIGEKPRTFELVPGDPGYHYLDTRLGRREWRNLGSFTDKELRSLSKLINSALKT
jgi:hypothetical protein